MAEYRSVDPFLKWAGGKRWLAASDALPRPDYIGRYLEPFMGSAAVFFRLQPKEAVLSDLNSDLVDLYCVMRDTPCELWSLMLDHQRHHCSSYYYSMRDYIPSSTLERAARTLYLNRTCWNGLYRVNRKGQFNVPIGTKDTVVFSGEDFGAIAEVLRGASIRCCDFADTVEEAGAGDFLFVDPPYTVKHNMNGFVKYNETIFSWADQVRLRDAVHDAATRGASVVVTNADHDSVRDLYKGSFDYRPLSRSSVLAGLAGRRGLTTEALFSVNL